MASTKPELDKTISESVEAIRRRQDRIWEHRFVWFLLVMVLGLWGYFYAIGHVDQKIAKVVAKRLREEFPSHLITVERAHLQSGHSITIEGIRISKATDQGLRDVVRIGQVVCEGPIELVGLAQGQFPIQNVIAEGVEICLWPLSDGRLSIQEFASKKPIRSTVPPIEIRSGLLRIGGAVGRADQEIICHDLRLKAMQDLQRGPVPGSPAMLLHASVASSYFSTATIRATVSGDKTAWDATGAVTKIDYSQRLVSHLPSYFQSYLAPATGFSGQVDVQFQAQHQQGTTRFKANADVVDGRLMHPKVPYPLEAISGHVYCDNELLQLRNIKASSGDASIAMACDHHGLAVGSPMTVTAVVQNLSLDQRLFQALPAAIQETWQRMGVSGGVVDGTATVAFDGSRWTPQINVTARNAAINAEYFPYPLTNLSGQFAYNGQEIVAKNLTARAGDQTLRGALTLVKSEPRWLMDLMIAADGPITIDEPLLRALSPRDQPPGGVQTFIRSLHPTGTVLLKSGRFRRTADQPEVVSRAIELTFSECSVRYDSFRYPVANIQGQAIVDNDRILLKDLRGRNDGARIRGEGTCQCRNSNLDSLDLVFEAQDIALDEELQQALPRSVRGLWDQLRPSGVMDRVGVKIHQSHHHNPLDLQIELIEERDGDSRAGHSVSLYPTSIPYAVNDIACKILYRPGRIEIQSLSGLHEASRLQVEGQCDLRLDGTWTGMLTWMPSTRFLVDQQFLSCMPINLREPLLKLDYRGPVSITGSTHVGSQSSPSDSLVRQWDLELQIEDGRLGEGNFAAGIRGTISMAGENTGDGPRAFGQLEIDAASIKHIAVTGLKGPFAFNQRELLFGREAVQWKASNNMRSPGGDVASKGDDRNVVLASHRNVLATLASHRQQRLQRVQEPSSNRSADAIPALDVSESDIRARMLSGTMFFSGIEPFNGLRSKYRLRLVDSDFHGFLVDQGETHTQASGRLSVQCDLQGSLTNIAAMEGKGKAWLREANLYELPAMVRLFRLLSVRPDQGAFDSADIDFDIDGDRIPVSNVQLEGDLISMHGSGWVNMRRELHFDLDGNVGNRTLAGAIFRPIANQTNTRLFRIEVDGTTSDLQMKRTRGLMNTLEHVLPEPN